MSNFCRFISIWNYFFNAIGRFHLINNLPRPDWTGWIVGIEIDSSINCYTPTSKAWMFKAQAFFLLFSWLLRSFLTYSVGIWQWPVSVLPCFYSFLEHSPLWWLLVPVPGSLYVPLASPPWWLSIADMQWFCIPYASSVLFSFQPWWGRSSCCYTAIESSPLMVQWT